MFISVYISITGMALAKFPIVRQDLDAPNTVFEKSVERPPSPTKVFDQVAGLEVDHDTDQSSSESSEDEETLTSYQEDSISSIALENVRLVIDRLFKLAFQIRSPVTRLGFSKARDYQEIDDETGVDTMSHYASFDLRHVSEIAARYWRKPQDECESHYLVQRLARANTHRRRQFGQWRRQKYRVDNNAVETSASITAKVSPVPSDVNQDAEKGVLLMPSTAAGLDEKKADDIDTSSVITVSTNGIVFKDDGEDSISIPPLPEGHGPDEVFECPYCYVLCSKRSSEKKAWE